MTTQQSSTWGYRKPEQIPANSLHIDVIADYGGELTTDHAFSEVQNHFFRFDTKRKVRFLSEHPVFAFSTIETGYWIGQEALHSQHPDLVIFSNTAPRGDIAWKGEHRQYFVCGLLDNGIPIFAVHAGYNLSFVKDRLVGLWEVVCPNEGTQFRSRDYYPEATMAILNGDMTRVGKPLSIDEIMDVPEYFVASIDGYRNVKTTIREADLSAEIKKSRVLRVTINGSSTLVLNTLVDGNKGKTGDMCMVVGSSGGKGRNFIEFIRLQRRAAEEFNLDGPRDDKGKITVEPV